MGRGLVEPLDDMEQRAWYPELLDWLAADLVENGYDLKKTMERILTSEAYQLRSVPATELLAQDYVFRGPLVRRLSAEQFQDALSEITGVWHALPPALKRISSRAARRSCPRRKTQRRVRWIWNQPSGGKGAPGTVYFRENFQCPEKPTQASAVHHLRQ